MNRFATLFLSAGLVLGIACGDNVKPEAGDAPEPMPDPEGACGIVIGSNNTSWGSGARGYGEEVAGIPVMWFSPDGELLGRAVTDIKGEASFDACVVDTMITFAINITNGNSSPDFITYTHVQPGDTAYYKKYPDYVPLAPTYANVSVIPDSDTSGYGEPSPEGSGWIADIGCDDREGFWNPMNAWVDPGLESPLRFPGTGNETGIYRGCLGRDGTTVDVLARLYDDNDGNFVGYSFAKDVAITEGTVGTQTDTDVELPEWTYGDMTNAWIVKSLPQVTEAWYMDMSHSVDGVFFAGDSDDDGYSVEDVVPAAISGDFEDGLPDDFGDASYGSLWWELQWPFDSIWRRRFNKQITGPFTNTLIIDASDALPRFDDVVPTDIFTTQPKMLWFSPEPIKGTMAVFELELRVEEIDGCCGTTAVDFYVVTPLTDAGEFTMPQLPEEFLQYFAGRTLDAIPEEMSIIDTSWTDYTGMITNPPFNPISVLRGENYYPAMTLPEPSEGTAATLRRTNIESDLNDD